jgi:rhombotail lipoprotein
MQGVVAWLLMAALGCAGSQGLDHAALKQTLRQDVERLIAQGSPAPNQTSRLVVPFTLGVYFTPANYLHRRFEWTDADKETLVAWGERLKREGVLSDILLLADSSVHGTTLNDIRLAAARYGADAVLIVDGAAAVDRYNNAKAAFAYWTILGAYLASGTHSDALVLLQGTFWEIRTRSLRFSVEAEGLAETVGPAAFVRDRDTIERAKRQALEAFEKRLEDQLKSHLVKRTIGPPLFIPP